MLGASEDEDDLAFDFRGGEVRMDFAEGAADRFGMEFADFAADADLAVIAEDLDELFEEFYEAVGALVDNHGAGLGGETLDSSLAALLVREEAFEDEAVAGQAAIDESRDESRCTGEAFDIDASLDSLADKEEAWVGDAWGSSIGNESDIDAGLEFVDDTIDDLVFVEDVVGLKRSVDGVMLEENTGGAGVLGQNEATGFENLDGTEGHVAEVPNRCRDEE